MMQMPDIIAQLHHTISDLAADTQRKKIVQSMEQDKRDLLNYCNSWLTETKNWRKSSWESKWIDWQRAADSIYDPDLIAKKEAWQSKAYISITASQRETIQASLFRTIFGARPILEVRRRYEDPDDQSENIRDLILREMERSRMEMESNGVFEDATTFGSGFCRVRWEEKYEKRLRRSAAMPQINPADMAQVAASMSGQLQPTGFEDRLEDVPVYRGVKIEHLSIWDVFIDPKALEIPGNHVAYRCHYSYGDLVRGAEEGYYLPEVVSELKDISEEEPLTEMNVIWADRLISSNKPERSTYGNKLECYELFARLPKKWVMLGNQIEGDPEELVPSRIIFHKKCLVAIEPSREYAGEPPIYHMKYMPVASQLYGRGIPEMLCQIQEVINETVNQRIDNVSLQMNAMFAVIDKAIVDRNDLVSKPGGCIRINSKFATNITQAFQKVELGDVTVSAYRDVLEMERYAQERTSANRITMGTAGMVKDANQTLGGMEILRQTANEKFAYIGMLAEFGFFHAIFRAFWKTIYANISPQDIIDALGPRRASTFKLMSPEDIETKYIYEPQGIYTMENRALMQSKLAGMHQLFAQYPWYDAMKTFDRMAKYNNLDSDSMKYTPEEMKQMMMAQAMASGQFDGQPMGSPPKMTPGQVR